MGILIFLSVQLHPMSDSESIGSEASADGVMRFWGARVDASKPVTMTLDSTELRVSQACLSYKGASGGQAVLYVRAGIVDEPLAVCVLKQNGVQHSELNLEFFTDDGAVEFTVVGNAAIDLTGACMCGHERVPHVASVRSHCHCVALAIFSLLMCFC
jgi:hypothetical protein